MRAPRTRAGSSPLTRGAPQVITGESQIVRLIPAHAGSTTCGLSRSALEWAHPRSRGEHMVKFTPLAVASGSSPLTRGARDGRPIPGVLLGLIPAHAGSTQGSELGSPLPEAHPRSRGEHPPRVIWMRVRPGSSPLTRGAPFCAVGSTEDTGLIPAHAGSTWTISTTCMAWGAHPRSRGEHPGGRPSSPRAGGSSPLTRGAPNARLPMSPPPRLIPAHAGSTTCGTRGR